MIFDQYLALGDSITTDDYPGAGFGMASLLYKNKDNCFPDFRGRDLYSYNSVDFHSLAINGGVLSHVSRNAQTFAVLTPEVTKLRTLITLTIGGNDIVMALSSGKTFNVRAFKAELSCTLKNFQDTFRDSVILLGNVYDPTDGTEVLPDSGIRLSGGKSLLDSVNNAIHDCCRDNIHLCDIHTHFLGHGYRRKDTTYKFYNSKDQSNWYMCDIEPNNAGAHEARRVFLSCLNNVI